MENQLHQVVREFSKELMEVKKSQPKSRRYSKELRVSFLALSNNGVSQRGISKLTGLSTTTLYNWDKNPAKQNHGDGCFKEISVLQDVPQESSGYTIETPSSYKIRLDNAREISSIIKAIESY